MRETVIKMRGRSHAAPRSVWPDDEVDRLRAYLKAGVALVDIARALGRTLEEVAAKLIDFQPVRIRVLKSDLDGQAPDGQPPRRRHAVKIARRL